MFGVFPGNRPVRFESRCFIRSVSFVHFVFVSVDNLCSALRLVHIAEGFSATQTVVTIIIFIINIITSRYCYTVAVGGGGGGSGGGGGGSSSSSSSSPSAFRCSTVDIV